MIDEKDLAAFQRERENMARKNSDSEELRREWLTWRAQQRERQHPSDRPPPPVYTTVDGANLREEFVTGDMTREEAQAFCPSPVRLYRDPTKLRWQAHFPGVGSRSRAFSLYGPALALRLVLQWAWSETLLQNGLSTSACPVRGIFPEASASSSGN